MQNQHHHHQKFFTLWRRFCLFHYFICLVLHNQPATYWVSTFPPPPLFVCGFMLLISCGHDYFHFLFQGSWLMMNVVSKAIENCYFIARYVGVRKNGVGPSKQVRSGSRSGVNSEDTILAKNLPKPIITVTEFTPGHSPEKVGFFFRITIISFCTFSHMFSWAKSIDLLRPNWSK